MPTDVSDRLDELRAWANSRINHCRREELKFGRMHPKQKHPAQALIEA